MVAIGDNSTAIMAALPAMARELHLDHAAVEWVVNAYLLASACFIVFGGESADRFGARQGSIAGISVFGLASLVIALAPDGAAVLTGRVFQGLGAAFAVAGTLAAVNAATPPAQRAGAIGAWTGFLMLGFSLGPLVGGLLTHYFGWRMNFWLNLVLMALSAAGLVPMAAAPALRRDSSEERWPDWPGLVLLGGFMTALIFALRALPLLVAAPCGFGSLFALTLLALAGLLRAERGRRRPLVDFRFFAERSFAIAAALLFLSMFNIMTLLLYYNLYAQSPEGLDYSPISAGLSLLPLSLALIGFARAAPRLAPAIGLRRLVMCGMTMTAVGCLLVYVGVTRAGPVMLGLAVFVTGAGIALPYASAPRLGLSALSDSQAGQDSGMLNSCSFLGGTIGVTCGGIAFMRQGIGAVLAVVAISALLGAALCLFLRGAAAGRPMRATPS
jgi:MFS family permease